jgi:hypothetical protein
MSAVLDQPKYTASLTLAAGVTAYIQAPTLEDLSRVIVKLQPAANDAAPVRAPKPSSTPAAGNVASTADTQATAPGAASGSAEGAEGGARPTYDDVKARVLKLAKINRETAAGALGKFGVDHGNKLKLEQYPAFIAHADELLAKGGASA